MVTKELLNYKYLALPRFRTVVDSLIPRASEFVIVDDNDCYAVLRCFPTLELITIHFIDIEDNVPATIHTVYRRISGVKCYVDDDYNNFISWECLMKNICNVDFGENTGFFGLRNEFRLTIDSFLLEFKGCDISIIFNNSDCDKCVLYLKDVNKLMGTFYANNVRLETDKCFGRFVDFYYSTEFKCYVLVTERAMILVELSGLVKYLCLSSETYGLFSYVLSYSKLLKSTELGDILVGFNEYFMRG